MLDPEREFDVVTIPLPLTGGHAVERLTALCVNVMWAGGAASNAPAAVRVVKFGLVEKYLCRLNGSSLPAFRHPQIRGPGRSPSGAVGPCSVAGRVAGVARGSELRRTTLGSVAPRRTTAGVRVGWGDRRTNAVKSGTPLAA
jgi:hypothetical protein